LTEKHIFEVQKEEFYTEYCRERKYLTETEQVFTNYISTQRKIFLMNDCTQLARILRIRRPFSE
jgi:predicted nucleic-acid-binding Zn-ribbon protein